LESTTHKQSLKGAFITLEGIDGCGKTTQAKLLAERLRQLGTLVVETREPGGTAVGRALRQVLLDPDNLDLAPETELLLFLADRLQHLVELIKPALARGDTVICDRFHDSTVAFQKFGRQLDFSTVESVVRNKIEPATPDLTFWMDLTPCLARERIRVRHKVSGRDGAPEDAEATRLENEAEAFHKRVQNGYEVLYGTYPQRIVKIDAAAGIGEVAEQVWALLTERFDVP